MTALMPAPWFCARCRRALWWADVHPNRPAVLVDVEGRQRCRPSFLSLPRPHAMPYTR